MVMRTRMMKMGMRTMTTPMAHVHTSVAVFGTARSRGNPQTGDRGRAMEGAPPHPTPPYYKYNPGGWRSADDVRPRPSWNPMALSMHLYWRQLTLQLYGRYLQVAVFERRWAHTTIRLPFFGHRRPAAIPDAAPDAEPGAPADAAVARAAPEAAGADVLGDVKSNVKDITEGGAQTADEVTDEGGVQPPREFGDVGATEGHQHIAIADAATDANADAAAPADIDTSSLITEDEAEFLKMETTSLGGFSSVASEPPGRWRSGELGRPAPTLNPFKWQ